jgi:hypothetical protein
VDDEARVSEAVTKAVVCALKAAPSQDNGDTWLNPTEVEASRRGEREGVYMTSSSSSARLHTQNPIRGVGRSQALWGCALKRTQSLLRCLAKWIKLRMKNYTYSYLC